jgi:hypothetical protein
MLWKENGEGIQKEKGDKKGAEMCSIYIEDKTDGAGSSQRHQRY